MKSSSDDSTQLPLYRGLLSALQTKKYSLWSFQQYIAEQYDLPSRLAVIRHDIHHRDIPNGYQMMAIEHELVGKNSATYFITWGEYDQPGSASDTEQLRRDYGEFATCVLDNGFHLQPHIGVIENYISRHRPEWANWPLDDIDRALDSYDYSGFFSQHNPQITIGEDDPLGLNHLLNAVPDILEELVDEFQNEYGIPVSVFSSHGYSGVPNRLANSYLCAIALKRNPKPFMDTYHAPISHLLDYRSDNVGPLWIDHPDRLDDRGKFQFLLHPYVWDAERLSKHRELTGIHITPLAVDAKENKDCRSDSMLIINELKSRGEDISNFDVLDTNAGKGMLTCPDIYLRVKRLTTWEIEPQLESLRRSNLPAAPTLTVNMESAIQTSTDKYDWIFSDLVPRPYPNGTIDHFGMFPHVFGLMKDVAFLTINVLSFADEDYKTSYPGAFSAEHLEARSSFYQTRSPELIPFDDLVKTYIRCAKRNQMETDYWFLTPKMPGVQWLTMKFLRDD